MGTKSRALQKVEELLPITVAYLEKKRLLQREMGTMADISARHEFMNKYFACTQEFDDLLTKSFLHPATIKTLLKRAEVIVAEKEKRRGE